MRELVDDDESTDEGETVGSAVVVSRLARLHILDGYRHVDVVAAVFKVQFIYQRRSYLPGEEELVDAETSEIEVNCKLPRPNRLACRVRACKQF